MASDDSIRSLCERLERFLEVGRDLEDDIGDYLEESESEPLGFAASVLSEAMRPGLERVVRELRRQGAARSMPR